MTTSNQGAGAAPVDAVLGALERMAADLRQRTEAAESRAAAAEEQLAVERDARRDAEARAVTAESAADEAGRRAEALEAATRDAIEQLRRELLAALREAGESGRARRPASRPEEPALDPEDRQGAPYRARHERDLAFIPEPTAGRAADPSQPSQRQWSREERGYAWVEDEPGPSWWRRIFGRRY